MSIKKERIKFENQDVILKINLGVNNNISGYQQEIDELTEKIKIELTNPITDNEVRRFQLDTSNVATNIIFYFTENGTEYSNSFGSGGANFLASEIETNDDKFRNSFFILDFYDSFDDFNQTKIFTTYQTKIYYGEKLNEYSLPKPNYRLDDDTHNQFQSWYIPKTFIDKNLITGTTTVIGYSKFSFYNAKYGNISLFYNKDNENIITPEYMYFKTKIDLINLTWKFEVSENAGSSPNFPPDAVAYQLPFTNAYSKKVNDGIDNFNNKKQEYPSGNTFNQINVDYEIL